MSQGPAAGCTGPGEPGAHHPWLAKVLEEHVGPDLFVQAEGGVRRDQNPAVAPAT